MFHTDKSKQTVSLADIKHKHNTQRLNRLLTIEQLFIVKKRQEQLKNIQLLSGLEDKHYDAVCQSLLSALSLYLQDLPETRNSYFSGKGGFLDHMLSRCEASLQSCRAYFVTDDGKMANTFSDTQQLWIYCLLSASLLRGIGRVLVDLNIDIFDEMGKPLGRWDPMQGPMGMQKALFYDHDFDKANHDVFRRRVTISLATKIMPKEGLGWLSEDKDIFSVWLALLDEDSRAAGTLGLILDKAEMQVINRHFHERFLDKYKDSQGVGMGHKFNAAALDLDSLGLGDIPPEGLEFIKWLTKNLASSALMINKAPLLAVPGGLLMCPEIFQLFIRDHPQFKNWQAVQKAFGMLQLTQLGVNGSAEHHFTNAKTGMVHSGMILNALGVVLPEQFKLMLADGVIKSVAKKNASMINQTAGNMVSNMPGVQPIQALSSAGQWIAPGSLAQSILSNKQQG